MATENVDTSARSAQPSLFEQEIWKPIPSIDHAEVSNMGRVRTTRHTVYANDGRTWEQPTRILAPKSYDGGYDRVGITRDGKGNTFLVHRFVATVFIPNPFNKPQVNHKNGIKTDNRVDNLEWATRFENAAHAYETGLNQVPESRGEKNGNAKLTKKQVIEIRSRASERSKDLADEYGVHVTTIYRAWRGNGFIEDTP